MMKLENLDKLLVHELKDLHSAENQLLDALPKMAAAAKHADLSKAFKHHLEQTKTHVSRLETIFAGLEFEPGGHRCAAMSGLIDECEQMIKADAEDEVRDAGLIACAQRVEHYEIAAYGTSVALAEKLGRHEVAEMLRETLEEEGKADRDLTHIANHVVNFKAMIA